MIDNNIQLKIFTVTLFGWPIIFVNSFILAGVKISSQWEVVFLLLSATIGLLTSLYILNKSIQSIIQIGMGSLFFTLTYTFLARVSLKTIAIYSFSFFSVISIDTISIDQFGIATNFGVLFLENLLPPILLIILLYPLISWIILVDLDKESSVVPFQRITERLLERITLGSKIRTVFIYVIIFGGGLYLNLIYFTSRIPNTGDGFLISLILSLLVVALFLPILNTGYITAQGYVDTIRGFTDKNKSSQQKRSKFSRYVAKYVLPVIPLGLIVSVLGSLILTLIDIFATNNPGSANTTNFFSYMGLLSILAKLILGGIGAVDMTIQIWEEIEKRGKKSTPMNFYPIYILSALLLTIAVEFIIINLETASANVLNNAILPLNILFVIEKTTILVVLAILLYKTSKILE